MHTINVPDAARAKGGLAENISIEANRSQKGSVSETTLRLTPTEAAARSSWRAELARVLPHEWIFGTFLLLTGMRLFLHGGAARPWSFVFFGCLMAASFLFTWAEQNPTPLRWRVRLLFYPVAMGI